MSENDFTLLTPEQMKYLRHLTPQAFPGWRRYVFHLIWNKDMIGGYANGTDYQAGHIGFG